MRKEKGRGKVNNRFSSETRAIARGAAIITSLRRRCLYTPPEGIRSLTSATRLKKSCCSRAISAAAAAAAEADAAAAVGGQEEEEEDDDESDESDDAAKARPRSLSTSSGSKGLRSCRFASAAAVVVLLSVPPCVALDSETEDAVDDEDDDAAVAEAISSSDGGVPSLCLGAILICCASYGSYGTVATVENSAQRIPRRIAYCVYSTAFLATADLLCLAGCFLAWWACSRSILLLLPSLRLAAAASGQELAWQRAHDDNGGRGPLFLSFSLSSKTSAS